MLKADASVKIICRYAALITCLGQVKDLEVVVRERYCNSGLFFSQVSVEVIGPSAVITGYMCKPHLKPLSLFQS